MRKQTFMLFGVLLMVMTGCWFLDPPQKKVVNPKTGETKWVDTGEDSPAGSLAGVLLALGVPLAGAAGVGLQMAVKARKLQRAMTEATELAIANGSLSSATSSEELKTALRDAQAMSGDAKLLAKYFNGTDFKKIKNKVKNLLPAPM